MDLLFKRYASPFLFIDQMIASCRLTEFICEMMDIKNNEEIGEARWEVWLHKIFDKSYADFLDECVDVKNDTKNKTLETTMSNDDVIGRIRLSMEVWEEFNS